MTDPLPSPVALGLTSLVHHASVTSTMDVAHALAQAGAAGGTLVVADEQTAGRGRSGRTWHSARLGGLWMTLLERPETASGLDVLSLRLGLALADRLDEFVQRDASDGDAATAGTVRLKWPNDLFVGRGKLAGILVETRWREQALEWVCVGVGINMRPRTSGPAAGTARDATRGASLEASLEAPPDIAALRADVTRAAVLLHTVPAMRAACHARGPLDDAELSSWRARDMVLGRRVTAPIAGVVRELRADGALRIDSPDGPHDIRSGSLVVAPTA